MPRSSIPVPGSVVAARVLESVVGTPVPVPDARRLVHIQFRRFAGCPVCNLHLRSVARRHGEIEAAGVREVVVFHAPADELAHHVEDLPFAVIADPERTLYREFGVESSPRSLLDPRAWVPIVRAVLVGTVAVARGRAHLPARRPHGGRLGLPADFLLAPDGTVIGARRGSHVADQWTVDDVLALAARAARPSTVSP